MTRRRPRRSGYTLLEVLAAATIGLMLMAALYVSFDLLLTQTDSGRAVVSEADLSRGVANRLTIDLSGIVGVPQPKCIGDGSTSSADSGTTTASTTSSTGTEAETATATTIPLHAGVMSTDGMSVTLFVSKVAPWQADRRVYTAAEPGQVQADLVKITYYMHSSGRGLCRQERPWVTADGINTSADPDYSTEESDLIAPEVIEAAFSFASGTGYVSSWDGSAAASDTAVVQGPPRAIKVNLTFELMDKNNKPIEKTFAHVIAVRAASGTPTGTTTTEPSTTGSGTTGSTGTGTTGTTGGN